LLLELPLPQLLLLHLLPLLMVLLLLSADAVDDP